jgi:hypothetical protein
MPEKMEREMTLGELTAAGWLDVKPLLPNRQLPPEPDVQCDECFDSKEQQCEPCQGRGTVRGEDCENCDGEGVLPCPVCE